MNSSFRLGGCAYDVESTCFERRPHQVGMTARPSISTRAGSFRAVKTTSDISACSSIVLVFHFEQPCSSRMRSARINVIESEIGRLGASGVIFVAMSNAEAYSARYRIGMADTPNCARSWGRRSNNSPYVRHRGSTQRNREQAAML